MDPSNGYVSHLYLHDLRADAASRLTEGDCQVSSIAWSRDSSRLAYSHSDADGDSLRVIEIDDDFEAIFPTNGMPMSGLDWSADGSKTRRRSLDADARRRRPRSGARHPQTDHQSRPPPPLQARRRRLGA